MVIPAQMDAELLARMEEEIPEAYATLMETFGDEVRAVIEFSVQQQKEAATTAKTTLERNVMRRILFPNSLIQVKEDKNYNKRLRKTAAKLFMDNDNLGPVRAHMKADIAAMVEKYSDYGVQIFEQAHIAVAAGALTLRGKDKVEDEDKVEEDDEE